MAIYCYLTTGAPLYFTGKVYKVKLLINDIKPTYIKMESRRQEKIYKAFLLYLQSLTGIKDFLAKNTWDMEHNKKAKRLFKRKE